MLTRGGSCRGTHSHFIFCFILLFFLPARCLSPEAEQEVGNLGNLSELCILGGKRRDSSLTLTAPIFWTASRIIPPFISLNVWKANSPKFELIFFETSRQVGSLFRMGLWNRYSARSTCGIANATFYTALLVIVATNNFPGNVGAIIFHFISIWTGVNVG